MSLVASLTFRIGLSKACDHLCPLTLIFCTSSSRSTILVNIDAVNRKELTFEPGDHLAVFSANNASLVQELIDMMHEKPDPNRPIRIEVGREDPGKATNLNSSFIHTTCQVTSDQAFSF